jgi:MYXO-CTERM domain-containing protein
MVCNNGKNPLDFTAADMGARCGEPSCTGGNLTPAGTCDGMGGCAPGTAMACPDGAACADAMMCASGCTTSAECVSGLHCDMGTCVPDLPPGTACTGDADCTSGFCTDGVCCDTRCDGLCEACNVTGSEGACAPVPMGTDPAMECAGVLACNGMGMCEMPPTDAGVVDGGARDGGVGPSDAGRSDGGGLDGGPDSGIANHDAGGGGGHGTNGGCCRAVGSSEHDASGLALSLLGLALVVARRRRR